MKVSFLFLLLTFFNSAWGQTISIEDYFPLKSGIINVYNVSHITNSDTLQDEPDSSICKSYFVKGKEIFYFDNNLYSSDTTIIASQTFSGGVFYYDKGSFVFSPIFWKYELKKANLDYFEPLFPKAIKLDSIYQYQIGEEKRKYKFLGFETVYIKDKPFNDCLKLTIIQDWKTAQYSDTVWFQKGFGVIKWSRGTGRLEEIRL